MYSIAVRPSVALATGGILMLTVAILVTGCGGSEGQTPPPEMEAAAMQTAAPEKSAPSSPVTLYVYKQDGMLQWEMSLADDGLTFVDKSDYFYRFQNEVDAKRFLSGEDDAYEVIQGGQDWENAGGLTLRASDQKIVHPNGDWPFHEIEATYQFSAATTR